MSCHRHLSIHGSRLIYDGLIDAGGCWGQIQNYTQDSSKTKTETRGVANHRLSFYADQCDAAFN